MATRCQSLTVAPRSWHRLHGSEEYQSLLLQMHFLSFMDNPDIAGLALWQFADMPIDTNISDNSHRPGGLNNKGVVGLGGAEMARRE